MNLIDRIRAWRYERKLGYHLPPEELFDSLYDPDGPRGRRYAPGGYVPGTGEPIKLRYQHDLPDGEKDHLISAEGTRSGRCAVCGEQLFDPDQMQAKVDKLLKRDTPASEVLRDALSRHFQRPISRSRSTRMTRRGRK